MDASLYKIESILDQQLSKLTYPLQAAKDHLGTLVEHIDDIATACVGIKDQLGFLEEIRDNLSQIGDDVSRLVDAQRNQTMALENIATVLLTIADALTK